MKVAYCCYLRNVEGEGAFYRTFSLKKSAEKEKIPIDFYFFTDVYREVEEQLKENIVIEKIKTTKNMFFKHKFIAKKIVEKMNSEDYEAVILRYTPLSFWFYHSFKNKKFFLITEHHTKEIPEFISTKNYKCLFSELLSQKLCGKIIDGIIAVTDEIRRYNCNRLGIPEEKSITISNGIFVDEISFTKYKPFDGYNLDLIFVGTRNYPWHGLDRIIRGLSEYKNRIKIKLHIVGNIHENDIKNCKLENFSKIEFYGILKGKELDNLFSQMNLAVGTLALNRKKMIEACSLKVREYTARGIPFVISYKDVDLNYNLPFVKFFKDDEQPIRIDEVVKFAENISKNFNVEQLSSYMREYAYKNMDWRIKIKQYLKFIESFVSFNRKL